MRKYQEWYPVIGLSLLSPLFFVLIVLGFLFAPQGRDHASWTRLTGSLRLYEDIAQKSPMKPRAHYNLATIYRDRARFPEAIREYEKTAELAKTHCDGTCKNQNIGAVALSNIAALYLDSPDKVLLRQAGEMLERARQEFPPHESVLANSVEYWIQTGEWERASDFVDAALKFAPDSAVLYAEKADVMAILGRCAEQKEALSHMYTYDRLIELDHAVTMRPCIQGGF